MVERPVFNLLAIKGVPGALLAPDKGVADLEPGLGLPDGYLETFGVNIGQIQLLMICKD